MSTRLDSFDDLIAFLGAEGATFRHDTAAQLVQLSIGAPTGGSLFVRWERTLPYLQVVATILSDVPEDRLREVMDAVIRLTHALPLPGFGVDLTRRQIYFRTTLTVSDDGLPVDVLKRAILAVAASARDFAGPLDKVVKAEPGARVLQLVSEDERARSADKARDAGALFGE
jgi:hypothetical protein